ncbi:hypothetical protein J5834_04840 [bacterium]|nr:hypothetical protein [bacterium]
MTRFFRFFLPLFLLLLSGCANERYTDPHEYIRETEPNGMLYNAFEIDEGRAYEGKIDEPLGGADSDVVKFWRPVGTRIFFEFETTDAGFQPYIAHTDGLGNYTFATMDGGGRYVVEFIASTGGWQYFEFGDRRNTRDDAEPVGGFYYYFRVLTKHICDEYDYPLLKNGETANLEFRGADEPVRILELGFSEPGYYQTDLDSPELSSDKFAFILDCESGEVAGGSDDEDFYSSKLDPLIYASLYPVSRNLLAIGKVLNDFSDSSSEIFSVSFKKQPENEELEPNDIYGYANIVSSESLSGSLADDKKGAAGGVVDDEDWFRFILERGDLISVSVTPDSGEPFIAEMWAASYPLTSGGAVPLRANQLSGRETNVINMVMPFSGSLYFDLVGRGIGYSLDIKRGGEIPSLEFDGSGNAVIEVEPADCGWRFFKCRFPEASERYEISLSSPQDDMVGMHVFDSSLLPFAYLGPAGFIRFFAGRSDRTNSLVLGLYLNECEKNSGHKLDLAVRLSKSEIRDWTQDTDTTPVKAGQGGSFRGFFDTNRGFYENFFEIEIENDGFLYAETSRDPQNAFDINTVMTLFQDDAVVAESDDMIETIGFNKYSYLSKRVKKGEKYLLKVTPFMSESSNISAMNIAGSYILDIGF